MKTGNLTMVYGAVALLSVLLAVSYFLWNKKRERSFLFLLSFVAAANCGYFLLAAAPARTFALFANSVSYFGSAYSVLAMTMIVAEVCRIRRSKRLCIALLCISTAAFLLAASGDTLGLYYRSVEITKVNGMTRLIKDYGPLHTLYTVYLLGYVLGMVAMIADAWRTQRLVSAKYALLLLAAVLLNVGVWAVEQAVDIDFEFLCVSYVVTEVMLLLLNGILHDYGIVQPDGVMLSAQALATRNTPPEQPGALPPVMEEMLRRISEKAQTLSAAERRILNYYIDGYTISQIPDLAFISIHTVKKHNHSIYQKLEVASLDELMVYIELFRGCDRLQELSGG